MSPLSAKELLRILVSFAEADWRSVQVLLELLTPELQISRAFEPQLWVSHQDLTAGHTWYAQVLRHIESCDMALWMLSPKFLTSSFIRGHEIGPFLGPDRRALGVPVGLHPVPLDGTAELLGIDQLQIFRLDGRKWFSDCATPAERRRFCAQLGAHIRRLVAPPKSTW